MNSKMKKRLLVVTGVIVMVVIVVFAVVAGTTSAKTITVEQALSGKYAGSKIQVTGKVVDNSFSYQGEELTFTIFDEELGDQAGILTVVYNKGVTTAFGNQVTATCTGTINEDGVLECSELLTQCPSKYEGAAQAIGVSALLEKGAEVYNKPVKVTGTVLDGSIKSIESDIRLVLQDAQGTTLDIAYSGALSDEIQSGTALVISGSLEENLRFSADDIAIATVA